MWIEKILNNYIETSQIKKNIRIITQGYIFICVRFLLFYYFIDLFIYFCFSFIANITLLYFNHFFNFNWTILLKVANL